MHTNNPLSLNGVARSALVWTAIVFSAFATVATASEVCRLPSFAGMNHRTSLIKSILGENTTDISKIKLYISREGNDTYIQSNFLSKDDSNTLSQHPTKLRSENIQDLEGALLNTIFWADVLPSDATATVAQALKSVEVFVDRATIDQNGRPLFDLTSASKLRLAHGDQNVVETGELTTLTLNKPPPALIERISGCCLYGRPPGRAKTVVERMRAKPLSAGQFALLPLVIDSATDAAIRKDVTLQAALEKSGVKKVDSWEGRIAASFSAAKGQTLLILGHIEGEKVMVRGPDGASLFQTTPAALREMAAKEGVNLILFGCDTAGYIDKNSQSLGVIGKYNTATAAERLGEAMRNSKNHAELVAELATKDLKLVLYDERGGNGLEGVSAFAKVRGESFLTRVYRLLFLSRG